jgi:hypothetical protein
MKIPSIGGSLQVRPGITFTGRRISEGSGRRVRRTRAKRPELGFGRAIATLS